MATDTTGTHVGDGNGDEQDDIRALLAKLPPEPAPERFRGRLETRMRRRSRGRFFDNRWQYTGRQTYLGAAIVLVILAALYLFSQASLELRDLPPEPAPEQEELPE